MVFKFIRILKCIRKQTVLRSTGKVPQICKAQPMDSHSEMTVDIIFRVSGLSCINDEEQQWLGEVYSTHYTVTHKQLSLADQRRHSVWISLEPPVLSMQDRSSLTASCQHHYYCHHHHHYPNPLSYHCCYHNCHNKLWKKSSTS